MRALSPSAATTLAGEACQVHTNRARDGRPVARLARDGAAHARGRLTRMRLPGTRAGGLCRAPLDGAARPSGRAARYYGFSRALSATAWATLDSLPGNYATVVSRLLERFGRPGPRLRQGPHHRGGGSPSAHPAATVPATSPRPNRAAGTTPEYPRPQQVRGAWVMYRSGCHACFSGRAPARRHRRLGWSGSQPKASELPTRPRSMPTMKPPRFDVTQVASEARTATIE